jgi:DNA-binding MarR family transcriptional regulator
MGARKSSLPRAAASARANLELQTLQALRTIFGSARVHDAEIRRIASISGSQLWALSEIARSSAMSVKALAKAMALKQTSASNLVNALVERKLIRRARDAGDQRVVHLHVSQEGRRMLARAPGPYAGLLVDALQHLERDQLAQLREYLQLLVAVMKRPAASAAGETLLGE